ncbi:hypothetical protein B296_00020861 [Ensete ventricosum]|uniref:Serine-threonine/tyrosine-protein kinase catalytic domain-containing protein n=1 Tax=Ensete ventricosum TaxID=4639 RepID=A0A427AWR2_ENSVE|nr:hypothetical protein B296_00020861 [Ensete ventricosum]
MIAKNCYDPSEIEASRQLKVKAIGSKDEKKGNPPTVPKYVNLEPSLAMDWLEISWDELELKERIGAGTSFSGILFSSTQNVHGLSLEIWSDRGYVQVVGAVAFQNRRLTIPQDTCPVLAALMESCWAE